LGIEFETVRSHLRRIYEKLHVNSRTEAVIKYLKRDAWCMKGRRTFFHALRITNHVLLPQMS
jgi:hypothetical protein